MSKTISIIIFLSLLVVLINGVYQYHRKQEPETTRLICYKGDYAGQIHTIDEWRQIALDISKTVKNSKLNAVAKYGSDENVIGQLYLSYGIELFDYETN